MGNRMSRRDMLRTAGAGALTAAVAGKAGAAVDKPNVLMIPVDDLNDWVGCLGGHPQARTPNVDRLASRGVNFTRAYCAAPSCNPSRVGLLTGLRPSSTGVYGNRQPFRPVLPDAVTLPQHFMANGYRVVGGGKVFHGSHPDRDSWHDYFSRRPGPLPPKKPLNGLEGAGNVDWGPLDVDDDAMGDWKMAEWAAGELAKDHDRPFFLAAGIIRPHLPWYAPKKYFDLFPLDAIELPNVNEDDLDDIPPAGKKMAGTRLHRTIVDAGRWKSAVQAYLACSAFADACVGRLLDALEQSAYADNTVVVLWGDHGWHLGEKLHWKKFALWEDATRNPFIIAGPGVAKPGTRCHRTASLMDVYPTLVELCGLSPKPGLEGRSLAPLLNDPASAWDSPALTTFGRGNHSVRSERWRYIRYRDGSEELYDHENDELEWHNLAGKPELAEVKAGLAQWLPKTDAPDAPSVRKKKA